MSSRKVLNESLEESNEPAWVPILSAMTRGSIKIAWWLTLASLNIMLVALQLSFILFVGFVRMPFAILGSILGGGGGYRAARSYGPRNYTVFRNGKFSSFIINRTS